MAKNVQIDGLATAAKILSHFPLEEQEVVFQSMREQAPSVATKLERKLYDFERLASVKKQKLQSVLHETPTREIAISLKNAKEVVRETILENVSETKLKMVEDDYAALPPMKVSDVQAAQHRILKRLEQLYPEEVAQVESEPRGLRPRTA
jgi:flagellar motor switch protein FliG